MSNTKPIGAAVILQALYDSEINWSIATFWDGGFHWKLGDQHNGFLTEGDARTLQEAAEQLSLAAQKHFPGSEFARLANPQ